MVLMVKFCRLFQGENLVPDCVTISKCGAAQKRDMEVGYGQPKLECKLCGSPTDATS